MSAVIDSIFGPRVSADEFARHRGRYALPSLLLAVAALLLLISIFLPYWKMTLHAPQYPKGLTVHAYLNRLAGDVQEIDGLNHYIGMRPLGQAAALERSLSILMVATLSLLVVGAIFIHGRWAALLALPTLLFPAGFLVDLYLWMRHFGQNLDPRAPLSKTIKPFTPPVLGVGRVGQFETVAMPEAGLILATVAALIVLVGLWYHRKAYKPLFDTWRPETR